MVVFLRRRSLAVHELADARPYAALVPASSQSWRRSRLQGRFKSFPVETSEYLLTVCRYVERKPVRAGLVGQTNQWRWSSAATHEAVPLHAWPTGRPADWSHWVNRTRRLSS